MTQDPVIIKEWPEELDFESIRSVIQRAHAGAPDVQYNTTDVTESVFREKIREEGTVFTAFCDDVLVGVMMICVENFRQWYAKGKTAALRYIAVLPEYSGRGIASKLAAACIEWAEKHEGGTILWTTACNNAAAIATAQKNRFRKVDYLKFKKIDHDSVRLARWTGNAPAGMKCAGYFWLRKLYVRLKR